jgi:ComF family protein
LLEVARYPICPRCIDEPQPLSAEFFCVSCRTPFQNSYPLDAAGRCALCRGFDAAYSYGAYADVLRQLIHLFKYGKIKPLARPLGALLARALPRDEAFDLAVPVPLHWRRHWQRGFNQAELLAQELSRRTGIPVVRDLRRVRATSAQAGLSNGARRQNVAQAFRSRSVRNKRILLIDDVMTTGATATSCALALKQAGARRVSFLTVARVDRRIAGSRLTADYSMTGENLNGE